MRIAVIGGGINGVMSAWALARRGCEVTLYERNTPMAATSSASTKLLHGGIRYLEHGHFGLVRESLHERAWWIAQAPHLAHPLEMMLPIYAAARRGRVALRLGLALYDFLAGGRGLGKTTWHDVRATLEKIPGIKQEGLMGAYSFFDGQMDDSGLGNWAAEQACKAGVTLLPHTPVASLSAHGRIMTENGQATNFDRVVNAAGPWAERLLLDSGLSSRFSIDPVRGSHLLIDRPLRQGVLLEVPNSERIFFVLPYLGKTLIGTTEVRQDLDDPIVCSVQERHDLIGYHNAYFDDKLADGDVLSSFAGVRPLLRSHADPSRSTREYHVERTERLITIFGGKWTTARALGEKVARVVLA